MKKTAIFLTGMVCVALFAGSPVLGEDLGLSSILSTQGIQAFGQAVKSAAEAVFSSSSDVQAGLVDILNQGAAIGEEQPARYAMVAVMLAGGVDNLDASIEAINNSQMFTDFPDLVAETVAQAQTLLSGTSGGTAPSGADEEGGGGNEEGGGNGDDFSGGGDVFKEDGGKDIPATQI